MGSCAERGNLRVDAKGKLQMEKTRSGKVPMPCVGADKPVVALKPGNAGGAKGFGVSALTTVQLEGGGGRG
jgi:hypothetical protein